jgi:hypothetical protein
MDMHRELAAASRYWPLGSRAGCSGERYGGPSRMALVPGVAASEGHVGW